MFRKAREMQQETTSIANETTRTTIPHINRRSRDSDWKKLHAVQKLEFKRNEKKSTRSKSFLFRAKFFSEKQKTKGIARISEGNGKWKTWKTLGIGLGVEKEQNRTLITEKRFLCALCSVCLVWNAEKWKKRKSSGQPDLPVTGKWRLGWGGWRRQTQTRISKWQTHDGTRNGPLQQK